MFELEITVENLIASLLDISKSETVCILDSCGQRNLGSRFLIAGFGSVAETELSAADVESTLADFDQILQRPETATVFAVSYEFGSRLLGIESAFNAEEPDISCFEFANLVVHDYTTGSTRIEGRESTSHQIANRILEIPYSEMQDSELQVCESAVSSNMSRAEYLSKIKTIQEQIRAGNTYQTNLTQQLTVELANKSAAQGTFQKLRKSHPAAFGAFIARRQNSIVSISPERFVSVEPEVSGIPRKISSSPIKGTRKRSGIPEQDEELKRDLLESAKDRAENTMIVDLIRNDLGRVCEFGSVVVDDLCRLEEHETLFHLVSTVSGTLRTDTRPSEILAALFPCGSITGCPKISTMKLISELESKPRGISMGAIGYCDFEGKIDMSVAIRTMVIQDGRAVFNVGGGIVIDSDPESEYDESLLKALALLEAFGANIPT